MADSDAGFLDALINRLRNTMKQSPAKDKTQVIAPVLGTGGAQDAAQKIKHYQATLDQQLKDAGA